MSETEMCWIAVRCCCTPHKVLGFMRLTKRTLESNAFLLPPKVRHEFVDGGGIPETNLWVELPEAVQIRTIGETMAVGVYNYERAIFSEDRPIEFWRTVRGFVEVVAG